MLSFSRQYRLVSKLDFQSVFSGKPSKTTRKYLLSLYRPNGMSHARLGIIVAKQHVRQSVDRNQIRRIIRESFRHQKEALVGLDIVVLLRSKCPNLDKKVLRDDIDQLWQPLINSLNPS